MTVYNLPREEKWPAGLARVIQSYMQGQERKKQMGMAQEEARQKQKKDESDIAMKNAYITLLKGLGGGGQPQGPPQEGGGDTLPGLEDGAGARVSGWGPSGPRVEFQKPRTPEELIGIIAKIASHKDEFPEGSPQRKLADQAMMNLQSQLAKMQGQEIRETPPTPRDTPWYFGGGITDAIRGDIPAKTELVPSRKGAESPGGFGPTRHIRGEREPMYGQVEPGAGSLKTKGPAMFDLQKEAGIYDRTKPQAGKAQAPPPKDKDGSIPPANVLKIWHKLPTSVKANIEVGLKAGLTWNEIAASDDLKRYLK